MLVRDNTMILQALESLSKDFFVMCDTETTEETGKSSGGLYGQIRTIQLFQKETIDYPIVIDCFFTEIGPILDILKNYKLVFHNASYDLAMFNLHSSKLWLPAEVHDTFYLSKLRFYEETSFTFYSCLEHSGLMTPDIRNIDKKELQRSDWSKGITKKQLKYAEYDVVYLSKLFDIVKEYIDSNVYKLDIANLRIAVSFQRNGIPVNRNTVKNYKKKYIKDIEVADNKLGFNPRSSKQTCEALEISTSNTDMIQSLIQQGNEKAKLVYQSRHGTKMLSYLEEYDCDRAKGFFNPNAAISGRWNCSGGDRYFHSNLQQIPKEILDCFEAPNGMVFIYKDYSGLELRLATAYVNEETMGELMIHGRDMHLETARFIFNKNDISSTERFVAKTFNFALIYGAGINRLSQQLATMANVHYEYNEIKRLVNSWFQLYPKFKIWHNIMTKSLQTYGYVDVTTALGRKIRAYQFTDSLNFPIQGSAAEVTKTSLGILYNKYPEVEPYMVNSIHDANLLCVPAEKAEYFGKALDESMAMAWNYIIEDLELYDIPMPCGYKSFKVWADD